MTPAERFNWALCFCQRAQLRLTEQRKKMLQFLSQQQLPVSIEIINQSKNFAEDCAETTIYRTLMLFLEVDLVRQINLPGKTSYFILNVAGEPCDFLVCRSCGQIEQLSPPPSVLQFEQDTALHSGFSSIYHELELYGICPKCQAALGKTAPATKLSGLKRRNSSSQNPAKRSLPPG